MKPVYYLTGSLKKYLVDMAVTVLLQYKDHISLSLFKHVSCDEGQYYFFIDTFLLQFCIISYNLSVILFRTSCIVINILPGPPQGIFSHIFVMVLFCNHNYLGEWLAITNYQFQRTFCLAQFHSSTPNLAAFNNIYMIYSTQNE